MKILHVSQPVDDGVAVMVANLTESLSAQGWAVTVASPQGGYLAGRVSELGASHVTWSASREPGTSTLSEIRSLGRIVQTVQPDVVHLHSSKAGLAGRLAIRGRIPTVFSPHAWSFFHVTGQMHRLAFAWERWSVRWADVLLCGSQDEAREGRSAGINGNYRVIANSTNISNPGLSQAQARLLVTPDVGTETPVAVCFGRYTRQKGQDLMLAAWPLIKREVPGARLILVGSGPAEQDLRQQAPKDVVFQPAGDRESVAAWILASDVLAFPSRWETLSLAVLESLQLGRPVVVSDCHGMAEALEGGAGLMVPKEDPVTLAKAVSTYLGDRRLAVEDGLRAKTRFAEVHGRRRAAGMRQYRELLLGVTRGTTGPRNTAMRSEVSGGQD